MPLWKGKTALDKVTRELRRLGVLVSKTEKASNKSSVSKTLASVPC